MMESAASERPPLVQLIDRYASVFLSTIVVLAILSGLVWWQLDSSRAIWIAVTVLVITCPCALSLATPGVMSAAIGQLAKNGLLVARGRAIESLARTTHFVFDKTGTLTQGKLKLLNTLIVSHKAHFDEHVILQLTIDITARSIHPVAQALYTALSNQQTKSPLVNQTYFEEINEIPGLGIEAHHQNTLYRLGNLDFVRELHGNKLELPPNWANKSISALGDQNGYIAVFALEDTLRNDAKQLIELLQKRGQEVILLSGDRTDVVNQAATELGINKALSNLSPEAKYNEVKALQKQGAIVAMIGDGMNDGPVLSLANVSIAMGQGAPISQARSDMVLISNDLRDLAYAITITSKSLTLIRQNLGWAVIYNAIAIPAAMFGILAPWHAAIGMSLSSIIVVVNSLRLYKISNQHRQADNMVASQSSKAQLTTATSP
jgi:Cu2+-exporting ATPase